MCKGDCRVELQPEEIERQAYLNNDSRLSDLAFELSTVTSEIERLEVDVEQLKATHEEELQVAKDEAFERGKQHALSPEMSKELQDLGDECTANREAYNYMLVELWGIRGWFESGVLKLARGRDEKQRELLRYLHGKGKI